MRFARVVTACGVLVALSVIVRAQNPNQARDGRVAPTPTGTAQVAVLVTTDDTNPRPLRRVSVALQAGELDVPNIAVTDDEGRAVFRNLAAGNYMLTAVRTGYVRTFYGSKFPGRGPGLAVAVLDGQRVSDVRIRMMRGAVITGTIRTASGKPAPNESVQAVMVRSSGGERRATNPENNLGTAATDDRGVY